MRLKSLEIKGFKSFANDTSIHFGEDVIGIVGPNGSGKSNIVDAIRWVLGEQKSKELRLDQMTSVIFNGTKTRKPAGLAQVSLTFENTKNLLPTEYQTVTISRILYRTGESEYRLNNVTCRLKDITSLFLDTGVGPDSYAIIALGMVDDILSNKDNARRRMFEQAAGVSKYKIRKRETLSKLKSTGEDLERIEDLLFEIQGNLDMLEKQAKRTKKYFELKDQYKELSIELATWKASHLVERQKELAKQLQAEEDRHRQFDVQIRQLEAQLESEKKANLEQEKSLSDRQRDLNQLVGQIRGLENDKKMLEQKLGFLDQNKSRLGEQIQQTKGKLQQFDSDIATYQEQLREEKRNEARLESRLEEAQAKLTGIRDSHGAMKADLDAVVKDQQTAERAVFELEKRRAVNLNQAQIMQAESQRYTLEIASRQEEIQTLRGKVAELEKSEGEKLQALEQLRASEQKRQEKLIEVEAQIEALSRKMQAANRQLDAKRNEYKLTKSMVENLEGFPESIKFLSQSKHWKKEAPLLSDIIYVQEEYRVAIENYLEPYLSYYVVENLEEAYGAIKLLHDSQQGKANFFLLDAFADYQPPMTSVADTRPAIEFIETDPLYGNLINYLLENVLVTEKEEIKNTVTRPELTLLSKSGRFIQRKYSVSGGSIGLFEGKKIGRKKNLEVLETAIKKAEREENELSSEFFQLKNKLDELKGGALDRKIQEETMLLNRLSQEKITFQTRLENFESFVGERHYQQEQIAGRLLQLEAENQALGEEMKDQDIVLAAAKDQITHADGSYRQVAEELSQASAAYNQINIEFVRQQNTVTTIQRELSFRERQLGEMRAQLQQYEKDMELSDLETAQSNDQIEKMSEGLKEAYEQRKEKEGLLSEAEQTYFKARGEINEVDNQLRKVSKNQQEVQLLANEIKDKVTELRFQLTSLSERLHIEFQVSLNDLLKREVTLHADPAELQEKAERLKNRLDTYGEINPLAVEAYDEMKERYDTIKTQRDDVQKAKEDLMETIKEIEETATAQFLESFDKARLYFIDVFRSLFTEDDNCDLILLDPNDPLESDIEIVAKPKGKRPQTINQLSGGEKTLTAIAMLFALYLLKPAPFCVFDEVDAPLDDTNIEKFNRIIKKFSKESQFIIVTHNKATMAAVDTIYGVYMQEQGVSGVSHVDFRNYEHHSFLEATN
ncbi:MAG: chromosome segregation protein SMC [Saprospirales bacterium]|nr:chromosome segregation protein SMC [Saprospirales bacterium]